MKLSIANFTLASVALMGLLCLTSSAQMPGGGGPGGAGQNGPMGGMGGGDMGIGPASGPIITDPAVKTTYVRLGGNHGILYEPVKPGAKSRIGIFVMHDSADYTTFVACGELSKRGYRVLCAAGGGGGDLDRIILQAKSAVMYLRTVPGVQKVVLFGHSGGATLMAAYQDIAENGVSVCQGPEKINKCPNNLAGLPPADGLLLADSNWGIAEMTLFSIDPAVTDPHSGMHVDPSLDLYNPANGFSPSGSNYSEEFIHRFQAVEGKRETELIRTAQARLAAIEAGHGLYADDEPFDVPGANTFAPNNKLYPQDMHLMAHTVKAWPLLKPNGVQVIQTVYSVRKPMGMPSPTKSLQMGALRTTVRNFLSTFAIRVTDDYSYGADSVHGVDWTSTYSSPPGNVQGIKVPFLAVGMTGSWEYLASETIYNNAKSVDKSLAFVEGASHGYTVCRQCESQPGQFGDTVKTLFDYADGWLSKPGRF